jgi:hypothetical protein
VIRARSAAGREVPIAFEWVGTQLRVRFGRVDARFDRAPTVCRLPRDCAAQADQLPALACPRRVEWSCERHDLRCQAHCGPAARTPAQVLCGSAFCPAGRVCCNPIHNVCTAPGEGCGQ